MKREWDIEELIAHFTLSGAEMALLDGKVSYNQLGLAALLKVFQYEGKFPNTKRDIPRPVVTFIAEQLSVDAAVFGQYEWQGRTMRNDRAFIRTYLGFREPTQDNKKSLIDWLATHPDMQHEHSSEYWLNMAYRQLREAHLEPFSQDEMERAVRSALNTYQNDVCDVIYARLSAEMIAGLDDLLEADPSPGAQTENPWSRLAKLKEDPNGIDLKNVLEVGDKLQQLRQVGLPHDLFEGVDPKWVEVYRQRATAEHPSDLARRPDSIEYTLLAAFCVIREAEITDQLVDLLIQTIHKISTGARRKIEKAVVKDIQRVYGKGEMLFKIAKASLANREDSVETVVFKAVSEDKLQRVVEEHDAQPLTYVQQVGQIMRRSYSGYYRQMLAMILETLHFRSNTQDYQPILQALQVIEKYVDQQNMQLYPVGEVVPLKDVIPTSWLEVVVVKGKRKDRISRYDYELCVLGALRDRLRSTEIWVEGAKKYGNPEKVLVADFEEKRESYYEVLNQPRSAREFTDHLKARLKEALTAFNSSVPTNPYVKILTWRKGWIRLSPLPAQTEPPGLAKLKAEVGRVWSKTNLLDVLKEADLRIHFTADFKTLAKRQSLDADTLRKRLLLCLFGMGTNIGLKPASTGDDEQTDEDLYYVKRYFISREALRNANAKLVNATFELRLPHIWGEGSVACASDSRKFGVRGENLKTEWHNRYRGRGIMVYWHIERKALAIYSQLKAPSSSEVSSMIEGVLRHATTMEIERNYVDTHGQSEIAFAFCYLLGFELLPRFKNLGRQKLHRADVDDVYPNLEPVMMGKAIDWELMEQHYDFMIQYTTALLVGASDAETILKRFTQTERQHPTYAALAELGKVIKTIFLCEYLSSEALRREIEEGLNIIENWNSANTYVSYGRSGEFSGRRLLDHELSMLSLQLVQNSLIYVNTLMLQQVLAKPYWFNRMTPDDWRGLTPLFYAHINPYGTFKLEMDKRIPFDKAA